MRRMRDAGGRSWDVVVGRASWGAFQALFVPVDGDDVRQAHLEGAAQDEAERTLAELSDEALLELLDRAGPREP